MNFAFGSLDNQMLIVFREHVPIIALNEMHELINQMPQKTIYIRG